MGTTIQYAAWNRITNTPGFSTDGLTPDSPADAPVTLSPADPTVSPFAPPLNYYVRFTRADGSIITVNGGQFFGLAGLSFSDTQNVNIGSQSGGAGAGKAAFSPLQLSFSQAGLQPELLTMLAS